MFVGSFEDRGCGSVVEYLFWMKKVLGIIFKSFEDIKYFRKIIIFVVFIIFDLEDLKGLGFKDLVEGNFFFLGLIEGFLLVILFNNFVIYKENRDL